MADVTVTAADVLKTDGATGKGTAGATITAGQALYIDSTDSSSLKPADADVEASAVCVGIALHGSADGQPIEYQKTGTIDIGGTVTVGTPYFVSTTAGGIAPIADLLTGDYVTLIGIATAATDIKLNIDASGVTVP
jgi:hypothetical protein